MMKDRIVHTNKKKLDIRLIKGLIASVSLLCIGVVISVATISITSQNKVTTLDNSMKYNYQVEVARNVDTNNNVQLQNQTVKP